MLDELLFNKEFGLLGRLRPGLENGILRQADYNNLVQCETLEDIKVHLHSTDYGNLLANEASPLAVSNIDDKLREKLVVEFQYMRKNATGKLATFLDFITYSYMIDNIILLITGALHQRPLNELMSKCHPLGSFDEMRAIEIAQTPAELYNAVIIDTPLAPFFQDCLLEQDLNEMNIEIIRNQLYRAYLEAFYKFCEEIGGTTATVMCEILAFEADRRAFTITMNSFGTELERDERMALLPRCGKLNPDGLAALARAEDLFQVKSIAECYVEYSELFENESGDKTFEDKLFEYEVDLTVKSFMQQFHFGLYYAIVKLKEQEARNIVWISECVAQRHRSKIENYIPILP
ncbi:V-type proton ATPase subunit d-like [Galendromus occidentalis]|uniref:V-type proton ATPase subunit n=1 Tax=Galendromus occidentalis TaxID=34638 RepID=A0AAJ6QND4_9ACAR|nr:V-type proton ATPase subunit d-like [Galendromus occidentalis]